MLYAPLDAPKESGSFWPGCSPCVDETVALGQRELHAKQLA